MKTTTILAIALSALCAFSQDAVYNLGIMPSDGAKYFDSFNIFNLGIDPAQYATYRRSQNIVNIGADCGWQCNVAGSRNIMSVGFAAGEFALISQCHNLIFEGSEVGTGGSYMGSQYIYLYGHDTGNGMDAYRCSDIYAFGGLSGASLLYSRNVLSLGDGSGANLKGSYTNVVFIGDGSTLGPTGKDLIVAGPDMRLSLGSTNQWQFGEVVATETNSLITVTINGQAYQIEATPIIK